jgi:hypothetical protein
MAFLRELAGTISANVTDRFWPTVPVRQSLQSRGPAQRSNSVLQSSRSTELATHCGPSSRARRAGATQQTDELLLYRTGTRAGNHAYMFASHGEPHRHTAAWQGHTLGMRLAAFILANLEPNTPRSRAGHGYHTVAGRTANQVRGLRQRAQRQSSTEMEPPWLLGHAQPRQTRHQMPTRAPGPKE